MPPSKIPSIFDHTVLDSSTIESYYQKALWLPIEPAATIRLAQALIAAIRSSLLLAEVEQAC
jgi:hypothetical protein